MAISYGRRDQLKHDFPLGVLGKFVQSNLMFGLSDRLEMHLGDVRKPAGNPRKDEKTKKVF